MIVKLPDKSAKSVMAAFETLLDEIQRTLRSGLHNNYDGQWFRVCDISNLEKAAETLYTMGIQGSVECHNGLIRRFIP